MNYDLFSQPSFEQVTVVASDSPINTMRLSGQNHRLLMYLLTGKSIHCLHRMKQLLGIGYLNSRCSDLINKHKIKIEKHYIKVQGVTVVEYMMTYTEIERVKREFKIATK